MPSSQLDSLLKIRKQELDEAKKLLSEALARAMTASDAVKAAEQNMVRERDMALDFSADDQVVEAYSRWLPIGRAALDKARLSEQDASMEVESCRTRVNMARSALEAAEKLAEMQAKERRELAQKKEQAMLDDLAMRRATQKKPD
ncbi:flagellar FliJ family protein [Acetobacter sp.]|jgi:flagellar export protein FliJ|uniref:flagellar FliJ family protein n=1 Tax=Acetobacter sp. TaxID=440 RepID=UPI0025C48954|nr:flagellar FliJ family protein [Acetobacter sp.]MCH4092111.1 flagellar FliJ family protein [Acetobacter sp.]MCI1299972.1 flagellar FliJ family protein [Acetobacter sp.]MCI1315990.1 flagellar FliJ family protein [Acetobacter sp.]